MTMHQRQTIPKPPSHPSDTPVHMMVLMACRAVHHITPRQSPLITP